MTKDFKAYPAGKLDPRTKLVIVACLSSLAVVTKDIILLLGIFLLSLALILIFGVKPAYMWKKAKGFFAIVFFIACLQSVFGQGGRALIAIGGLEIITVGGLALALEFLMRMLIILTSAGILTTSGSRDIIQGLIQWKLPYEIAFMAVLGLGFLPVFGQEFRDARIAIQLRGVDMGALKFREKLEIYAGLMQPVIAGAMLKARGLSLSMEMRGFRALSKRVSYRELRLGPIDYIVMVAALGLTVGGGVII